MLVPYMGMSDHENIISIPAYLSFHCIMWMDYSLWLFGKPEVLECDCIFISQLAFHCILSEETLNSKLLDQ